MIASIAVEWDLGVEYIANYKIIYGKFASPILK